jgi:hypothetical protein
MGLVVVVVVVGSKVRRQQQQKEQKDDLGEYWKSSISFDFGCIGPKTCVRVHCNDIVPETIERCSCS